MQRKEYVRKIIIQCNTESLDPSQIKQGPKKKRTEKQRVKKKTRVYHVNNNFFFSKSIIHLFFKQNNFLNVHLFWVFCYEYFTKI